MPELPDPLFDQIVRVLIPRVRTPDARQAALTPMLSGRPVFDQIDWSGDPNAFAVRLVLALPHDDLIHVLEHLSVGAEQQSLVESLCEQVAACKPEPAAPYADPLVAYRESIIARWSQPRYELDKRFVNLTLLVDQGREAQGARFIEPPQAQRYDDLRDVLREWQRPPSSSWESPARANPPCCGGCRWTRRATAGATAVKPFRFSSRSTNIRATRLQSRASGWRSEWRQRYPQLPGFDDLLNARRLLLLLDALNEMPHRDNAEYRSRVDKWRAFLSRHFEAYGNRAVITCRSLDYSVSLSSEDAPAQQVNVKPLSHDQTHQFLQLKLPDTGEGVWLELQKNSDLLDFYSTPYFVQLLVDQVTQARRIPPGRAALFTGYVQQALKREAAERHDPLFAPRDHSSDADGGGGGGGAGPDLLDEADCVQIVQGNFGALELPEGGCLIPKLSELAFKMQQKELQSDSSQVRVSEDDARALLDHPRAQDILTAGVRLNVLDRERRAVQFFHQLLQEYFAARKLASQSDPSLAGALARSEWRAERIKPSLREALAHLPDYEPLPRLPTTGWEETIVIAAALSGNPEGFVRELAAVNLTLAAECAAAPDVSVSPALRESLQQALDKRMQDAAVDLRARIEAGLALGRLGRPPL